MTDYKHTSKDGKLWSRKLYGFEAQASYFVYVVFHILSACKFNQGRPRSQEGDGFTMYPGGLTVKLASPRTRSELERPLRNALLRARHLVPNIASKLVRHADGTDWFEYQVPATPADADKWAETTIVWHDEPKTLFDFDLELTDLFWKATDKRYNVELHVSPAEEGDWHLL